MGERLEQTSLKCRLKQARHAQFLDLAPRFVAAVEMVDDEAKQNEGQAALDHVPVGGGGPKPLAAAQERQAIREPNREEELRHDRVGVVCSGCDDGPASARWREPRRK